MSTMTALDQPHRPAIGWLLMDQILPPHYWREAPPAVGVELTITASDAVPTTWRMTEGMAGAVVAILHRRHPQVSVDAAVFDDLAEERRERRRKGLRNLWRRS